MADPASTDAAATTTHSSVGMPFPTMKIYYGPPGTGKTFAAAREAVRIIDGESETARLEANATLIQRYSELLDAGQIWAVSFHPTYSYEDFVEGLRPQSGSSNSVSFAVEDGPFKRACTACVRARTRGVRPGDLLIEGRGQWRVDDVSAEVVTLTPQTTGADSRRKFVPWAVVDALVAAIQSGRLTLASLRPVKGEDVAREKRNSVAEIVNVSAWQLSDEGLLRALVKTQLSADEAKSDESWIKVGDRIGAYDVTFVDQGGAVLKSLRKRKDRVVHGPEQYVPFWLLRRLRDAGVKPEQMSVPGKQHEASNELGKLLHMSPQYVRVFGPVRALYETWLTRAAAPAATPVEHRVVLIVEEINRADLARVFGDMLTLIETDKRTGMPEQRSMLLQYSRRPFSVPKGLSILGTMNTTDRSTFEVDHAFRRRFQFIEMAADYSFLQQVLAKNGVDGETQQRIVTACQTAKSRDYQIGHTYFMNVTSAKEAFTVWVQQIKPAVEQQYWSDPATVTRITKAFEQILPPAAEPVV